MGLTERPIRVSELAEFVYCNRAWWLKAVNKTPTNAASRAAQAAGERWHWKQGRDIAGADGLSSAGYAALFLAIALLAFAVWSATR